MRELGQVLRKKREALGLDLDEMQIQTKIRTRYLQALEDGKWDVLPGVVYARGFVRSYAEALGLDGMKLLDEYIDHTSQRVEDAFNRSRTSTRNSDTTQLSGKTTSREAGTDFGSLDTVAGETSTDLKNSKEETNHSDQTNKRQESNDSYRSVNSTKPIKPMAYRTSRPQSAKLLSSRKFGSASQVVVVVGALVVIGGVWFVLKHHMGVTPRPLAIATQNGTSNLTNSGLPANQSAANTATSNSAQPGGNQVVVANPIPANSTGNSTTEVGANGNSTNTTSSGSSGTSKSLVVTTSPFTGQYETYTVKTSDPLSVMMTATTSACWTATSADGKVIDGSDTVAQGQTRTWTANQTMSITLGHVAGVQITVNGQLVTLPATNNVITVTFTKSAP